MKNYFHISLLLFLGSIIVFSSCKEKKICAAYNSYFVYDATNNGYYFTPFGGEDSIPGERNDKRFNSFGLLTKNGRRNDKNLININIENLKAGTTIPDTSQFDDEIDSTSAIIDTKEIFAEKVNTDQEAYEHYVGELLKKYQKEKRPVAPVDTAVSKFSKPDNMTPEEEKIWKQERKERRKKEKEARKKAKEDELNKEDEDDFEFDLDL